MNNQSLSRSLAALTAVLTATACAPESEKSAWDYLATSPSSVTPYQQGKRDLAAGNYGLALEHFNAAVMQNPSSAPAWNGQAIALAKLDRDDEATAAFEKAMAIDANAPVTLSNYANFLERRGYHVKATTLLAKMEPAASAPGTAAAPAAVPAADPASAAIPVAATVPPVAAAPSTVPGAVALQVPVNLTIYNSSGQYRLARRLQQYLSGHGVHAQHVANAAQFDRTQSVLFCHAHSCEGADAIRRALPGNVKLVVLKAPGTGVELYAGSDLNNFDTKLASSAPMPQGNI